MLWNSYDFTDVTYIELRRRSQGLQDLYTNNISGPVRGAKVSGLVARC